jgi:hypothetical protein
VIRITLPVAIQIQTPESAETGTPTISAIRCISQLMRTLNCPWHVLWPLPTNENEKRHAYRLLCKTLEATKRKARMVIGDPQYSGDVLRETISFEGVKKVIIPYPANQCRTVKGLLRAGG